MTYSPILLRERIRNMIATNPFNTLTLTELVALSGVVLTNIDPILSARLAVWINTAEHDSMLINANVELVKFGVMHSDNGIADLEDVLLLLDRYYAERLHLPSSPKDALIASDMMDGILSDRSDISDEDAIMIYISNYTLRQLIAHETSNSEFRSYVIALNNIESIYMVERTRLLGMTIKQQRRARTLSVFKYFGATMLLMPNHRSVRISIHHGSYDYVSKKMKARMSGDYLASRYLMVARPHSVMIPPIRYICDANIASTVAASMNSRVSTLIYDYNIEHESEINENITQSSNYKLFPVQFRKSFIVYEPNAFISLASIRDAYIDAIKQTSQVSINRTLTQELLEATNDARPVNKLHQTMLELTQDVNPVSCFGIPALD